MVTKSLLKYSLNAFAYDDDDDDDDDDDRVCGVRPAWKFGGHEWAHMPAIWTAIKNNPPDGGRARRRRWHPCSGIIWAGKLQTPQKNP